jgi:type III restriction enzyme
MAEKNVYADAIGDYLWQTKEFGLREAEVLVIHTDEAGEITKTDLEKARQAARDIDKKDSKIKAIVSVMMLREGWDVRNVSVVLGLRPFTAKAEILPEQVIGRGLRLMAVGEVDRTQTLEVLGTRNLLAVLRDQLEAEGVGVASSIDPPPLPVVIEAVQARLEYDIAIPLTKPRLTHNVRRLSGLDPSAWGPIYDQEELVEPERMILKMEFVTTESEVGQVEIQPGAPPLEHELLSAITNQVIQRAKLTNAFAELYPIVQIYVATRCFGRKVDLDEHMRTHLWRWEIREGITNFLARKVAELTVEKRALEFERADFRLSETRRFVWRRNLPPLEAKRTVFNYVATYNDFERAFAEFLDKAPDVLRFASLGTTEQGESGTQFRVDYLKPSGAIGFYHPDWVVVQRSEEGEAYWIIETKGRAWEGTDAKDAAMHEWCRRVHEQIGQHWQFARVNQREFEPAGPRAFADAVQPKLLTGLSL